MWDSVKNGNMYADNSKLCWKFDWAFVLFSFIFSVLCKLFWRLHFQLNFCWKKIKKDDFKDLKIIYSENTLTEFQRKCECIDTKMQLFFFIIDLHVIRRMRRTQFNVMFICRLLKYSRGKKEHTMYFNHHMVAEKK